MGRLRALDMAKPFMPILPEIQLPLQKVEQLEVLTFTFCVGALFVVLSEIPLYGLGGAAVLDSADPIAPLRSVLAASRGTPLEFGILPIVLSGALFQIEAARRNLSVNLDYRADRILFQSAQKLVALAIGLALSVLIVLSGSYGVELTPSEAVLVIAQLFGGNLFLVLIDEVLEKGHGLGTGTLLFPLIKASQDFSWTLLSPVSIQTASGPQTYGVLPNLVFNLTGRSFKYAVQNTVLRFNLPNIFDIVNAAIIFFLVTYLSTFRLNLSVRSTKAKAQLTSFPVRLLYTNGIPVLITGSIVATVLFVSSALDSIAPHNILVGAFGAWVTIDSVTVPVSGVAAALAAPLSPLLALISPIRSISYMGVWIIACGFFSHMWAASSGMAAVDVAKMFKENAIVLVGKRDVSVSRELNKTIPLAATLGGAGLGAIVAFSDLFGRPGWAGTMVVGVSSILSYLEILSQEGMAGPEGLTGRIVQ